MAGGDRAQRLVRRCRTLAVMFLERDLECVKFVMERHFGKIEVLQQLGLLAGNHRHPLGTDRAVSCQQRLGQRLTGVRLAGSRIRSEQRRAS